MFEPPVAGSLTDRACADRLVASVQAERRQAAERLVLVAHWADLHHVPEHDIRGASRGAKREYAVPGGADGTPTVGEFAATELGMLLEISTTGAQQLIRDALNLRHRHPRWWEAATTGQVDPWKARKLARMVAAAGLDEAEARWVDAETIDALVGLPFLRTLSVVEGKIIAANPGKHEARRRAEDQRRYVSTGRRSNEFGLRTMVGRGAAGDIARLEAMVSHLAALFAARGDTDAADTRRAKALALLANPALACVYLANAQDEAAETSADAARHLEPEPEPPSAVDLAVAFGRVLTSLGSQALVRLRPRTVLHLHLAEDAVHGSKQAVVRGEDLGALSLTQLREWLHGVAGVDQVTVRPVVHAGHLAPVDAYEVPRAMRETLVSLYPYEMFPYGTLPSRKADVDHTVPYVPPDDGGPPGQTRLDNLGPLGRAHHRAKTFGGFTLHQPLAGMYLWQTPTGYWFQVDDEGTHPLGRETPAALLVPGERDASRCEIVFRELVLTA